MPPIWRKWSSEDVPMNCTPARALRYELGKCWSLPTDRELRYSGKDWVLVLLQNLNEELRAKVMFMWWRIWHHRNDCIFGKGDASYSHSASFLKNYYDSMLMIKSGKTDVDRKGKCPVLPLTTKLDRATPSRSTEHWNAPEVGWIKVNVDASFATVLKSGTWGAIARDNAGVTIFSAWGKINHCQTAQIAEAIACYEGLKLATTGR